MNKELTESDKKTCIQYGLSKEEVEKLSKEHPVYLKIAEFEHLNNQDLIQLGLNDTQIRGIKQNNLSIDQVLHPNFNVFTLDAINKLNLSFTEAIKVKNEFEFDKMINHKNKNLLKILNEKIKLFDINMDRIIPSHRFWIIIANEYRLEIGKADEGLSISTETAKNLCKEIYEKFGITVHLSDKGLKNKYNNFSFIYIKETEILKLKEIPEVIRIISLKKIDNDKLTFSVTKEECKKNYDSQQNFLLKK